MKKKIFIYLLMSLPIAAVLNSCSNKEFTQEPTETLRAEHSVLSVGVDNRTWPTLTGTISGVISSDMTLTNNRVWFIDGPTFVKPGVTLTIEANTLIKGKSIPTQGSTSYLVITRGAKIEANGGSNNTPIVFTSDKSSGNRAAGDWGGLIVLGDARTNKPNTTEIEIYPWDDPIGVSVAYGGNNNNHNGGIIKYVRIEFTGSFIGWNNEISGLTLGGVGSGTTLEYIQVSNGFDDGFEFLGGNVNAKHLMAYGNADDDFEFAQGYTGNIQFAVSRKVLSEVVFAAHPDGIDCRNDYSGSLNIPLTRPVISNMTVLGLGTEGAAAASGLFYGSRWRRNTSFVFRNSIIAGYDRHGVYFDGDAVVNKLNGGSAEFKNNLVHSYDAPVIYPTSATALSNYVDNTIGLLDYDANFMELLDPYNASNPDFRYDFYDSPIAIENSDFTGMPAFFSPTEYVGAFGDDASDRWDDVWASYQPNNNPY